MKRHRLWYVGTILAVLVSAAVGHHTGDRIATTDDNAAALNSESDKTNESGSDPPQTIEPSNRNDIVKPTMLREPKLGEPREAFHPEQAASAENIERFGEFVWPAVNNDATLFFHRGQYIDAPYVVRTRGLAVFVNDRPITSIEWPDRNFLADKPPMPAGLNAESSPHDIVRGRRLSETWPILQARWVNSHFSTPKERDEQLLRAYRGLPFVTETGIRTVKDDFVGERRILWFRTNTGEEKGIVSAGIVPGRPPRDPELILKNMHSLGQFYLRIVQSGGLQYRDGNSMAMISQDTHAWRWLPEVIDVLDADSTASNKERKLRILLNSDSGVKGSAESLISSWASKFQATKQLRQRVERIRRERTMSPDRQAPPVLPGDIPDPEPEPQTDGAEHDARRNLDSAIAEMIELLESKDFKNFVERYISPQYRAIYNYKGNTNLNPGMHYDLDQQPEIVEMYIQNLKWARQIDPIVEDNQAFFVHWFGREPHEFHLKRVGQFWYFR